MYINWKRRGLALLAAVLLCVTMCGTAVLADEAAEPETSGTVFDGLKAGNGFGTMLFVAGLGFVAVGAAGVVCLIFWQRASKRRGREEEDREEIFDEIKQAELRNRRKRDAEQQAREYERRLAQREKQDTAELPGGAQYAQLRQERPIVPTTPVSMQPNEVRRPRAAQPKPAPVKPAVKPAAKPAAPAVPAVKPAEKPAEKPASKPKYDLDDILREVRESKIKNKE